MSDIKLFFLNLPKSKIGSLDSYNSETIEDTKNCQNIYYDRNGFSQLLTFLQSKKNNIKGDITILENIFFTFFVNNGL